MKKYFQISIAIILLISFFYLPILRTFFVQDDYWFISISSPKNIKELLILFFPFREVPWYRPLSSQIFFFVGRIFFGLNPFPFHLVVLFTHFMTVYFLYKFLNLYLGQKQISIIACVLYGIHQLHTVSLSWLAAYPFVLGPVILLLTWYFFLVKRYGYTLLFFSIGLLTHEIFILLPLGLIIFDYFNTRKINSKSWIVLYFIMSTLIVIMRWVLIPTSQTGSVYNFSFSIKFWSALKFYVLRIFGVPMGIDQMSQPVKLLVILLLIGLWVIVSVSAFSFKNKQIEFDKLFLLLLISFLFISPFLLLPEHLAPHYLSFAALGFIPVLAKCMQQVILIFGKRTFVTVMCMYFSLQFIGIGWTFRTHWIFKRAALAKQLILEKKLIHHIGSEEYFALGAGAAEKVYSSK